MIKLDESSPTFFHFFFPKWPSCPAQVFPAGGTLTPLKTNKKQINKNDPQWGRGLGGGLLGSWDSCTSSTPTVLVSKCYAGGAKKEKAAITAGFLIKTWRLTSLSPMTVESCCCGRIKRPSYVFFFFYLCPINPVYYTSSPHTSVNSCCLQESDLLESRKQPGYSFYYLILLLSQPSVISHRARVPHPLWLR